jgi:hypothetical protein
LALPGNKILPGPADLDAADGFPEIFSEMNPITGEEIICLDGNGSKQNGAVFLRQIYAAGDMGIDFGNDLNPGQEIIQPFDLVWIGKVTSGFLYDVVRRK